MEAVDLESLAGEVDALVAELALERHRHVAGLEAAPELQAIFAAHGRAAHRETVAALRAAGEDGLALLVAALRAERVQASSEEAWRRAEVGATVASADGPVGLEEAETAIPRERDRQKRRLLGRAVAAAAHLASRERAVEERARARAEMGLVPDWDAVVAADELLARSEDAYRDVLGWLARREAALAPHPHGEFERADLLFVLALHGYEGTFPPRGLTGTLAAVVLPMNLGLERVAVDDGARSAQWPGAHVHEARISLRRQGGAADYLGLFEAVGRALFSARVPPHRREPAAAFTLGSVLSGLLLDRRFLAERLSVDKKRTGDLVRALALRELFRLRTRAAACRVATEVERGMAGAAWQEAHREAMTRAALAAWPPGLFVRDGDAGAAAASLLGAARGERCRALLVERFDEDWWRNPRASDWLANALSAGLPNEGEEPSLALAAEALAAKL